MTDAPAAAVPVRLYHVEGMTVEGLWGRDAPISLSFNPNVSILIGPNASGKTTLLNLMRSVLQVDVAGMLDTVFTQVNIRLRSQDESQTRTIRLIAGERKLDYYISTKKFSVPIEQISYERYTPRMIRHRLAERRKEIAEELKKFVAVVWLPVSRRLPISEEEDEEGVGRQRGTPIESVDHRLGTLLQDLARFKTRLDNELAVEYKKFEREVLSTFLYNSAHDNFSVDRLERLKPSETDKDQLMRAFVSAGLFSTAMRDRIEEHFAKATLALERLKQQDVGRTYRIEDILFLPLISRTKAMTKLAETLELRRQEIFQPLQKFTATIEAFFTDKVVTADSQNGLAISSKVDKTPINRQQLSSGEKQLLILLLQALVKEGPPVVYVADEPELSLHVTWQEKLLPSLMELGGIRQIIVATHSPDIVGPYQDKVTRLARI